MKKTMKKLVLRTEVVRDLAASELQGAAGGISGLRGCHSIGDNKCTGTDTGGATCTSGGPNCGTGLVSQCVCTV